MLLWFIFSVSKDNRPIEFLNFKLDRSKTVLLWWIICVLCFSCFCVCSLLPCCHLLGKGWPLGYCCWCLLYFCYFPMWYPGSGVVLDCIVSWSLPPFLLWNCQHSVGIWQIWRFDILKFRIGEILNFHPCIHKQKQQAQTSLPQQQEGL